VSITADHPHVHAARTPVAVPPELVVLRLDVFQPLRFGQAMVPVRKTADPIRVATLAADMFRARSTNILNAQSEIRLDCPFPCHRSLPPLVSGPRSPRRAPLARRPC